MSADGFDVNELDEITVQTSFVVALHNISTGRHDNIAYDAGPSLLKI